MFGQCLTDCNQNGLTVTDLIIKAQNYSPSYTVIPRLHNYYVACSRLSDSRDGTKITKLT